MSPRSLVFVARAAVLLAFVAWAPSAFG